MPPFRGLREAVGVVANLILYRWFHCHREQRSDVAIRFLIEKIATSLHSSRWQWCFFAFCDLISVYLRGGPRVFCFQELFRILCRTGKAAGVGDGEKIVQ